tara:strand:+ start:2380 stop:4185 length:1806 start_codon:yes stop_codon:yes gene_type:complete
MSNKLIGTDPNQVPSNADLGTLAYQDADSANLGLTTIATEGNESRQGSGTLLRIKRTGTGTWATLAIEAQSYRGNSRIAFVDSDHPNDVGTTGTADGGGAAPFIFDYEHETGKFQMISNAASRIAIDATGNVGIGTTAPDGKFVVSNSGAEGIEFFPAASSAVNTTQHYNRSGSAYVKNRTIALNHEWVNGGTDPAMNLIPDGNSTFLVVKAKASTYSSTANLSLYGTNPSLNGGSLVSRATIQAQTDGTAFGTKLSFFTNNTSNVETKAITIDAAQKVGIGTTNPLVKLDVRGSPSAPATSGTAQTGSIRASQTQGDGVLDMGFYTSATGTAWIQSTNKSNLATNYGLTLQPNGGNVGIGTTAPNAPLTVWTASTTTSQSALRLNNPGGFDSSGAGCEIIFSQDRSTSEDYRMAAISSGQQYTGSSAGGELKFWTRGSSSITNKMTLGAAGDLSVDGPVSIKDNRLTIDSDYGHWTGRYQTLVCHNAITANQAWTDVAYVSYSPSLTIQGTSQRDNNGAMGMASFFGTIFGGYGSVNVYATTNVASSMNGGGFGQLEYRYLNGGAASGNYRLQVRQAITAGTMYITTTLTGHAFQQITED